MKAIKQPEKDRTKAVYKTKSLTILYLTGLSLLALLIISGYVLVQLNIGRQIPDAPVINLSGRQRMLSQKLTKEVLLLAQSERVEAREQYRMLLRATVKDWSQVHSGLQHGNNELRLPGSNSREVRKMFSEIEPYYQTIINAVEIILLLESSASVQFSMDSPQVQDILQASSLYLRLMDRIVFQYEKEAYSRVHILKLMQTANLVFLLLLLVFEALLIFKPMVNRVRNSYDNFQKTNGRLKQEISQHQQTEEALRESEERFRSISQAANDAIIVMDNEGRISYWNPTAEKIFGYTNKEALGRELDRLIISREYHEAFKKSGRSPVPEKTIELSGLKKGGTRFPVEASFSAMHIKGRWQAAGTIRDISRRKQAEKELHQAKEKAETANRLKSAFLANMSHDIRTPLNSILGFTELLLEDESDPEKKENLEIVKQSGNTLLNLIIDILDFSRIEANKLTIDKTAFSLKIMLKHIHDMFKVRAKEKNLSFQVEIDEALPLLVYGDEQRINQIILNLLSNAFKFTEQGSVIVDCSYRQGTAFIKVFDSGPGIVKEKQEAIFSPFEQVDSSITRRYGGTGLGLAISSRLAELMSGSITMESEPGAGTTFTLSLPLPEAESGGMTNLHKEVGEKPEGFSDEKMVENWLRAMNNDPDLEKMVLECIKNLPGKIGSLEDAILSNIQKDIKYIAHDLKGVTGNLGMTEIHELAALIDEETDRQDYDLRGIVKSIPAQYLDGSMIETPAERKRKTDFKILLAEDNKINQKLVKRLINKMNLDRDLADNGKIALEKLKKEKYDLLLLDIQMPVMDGLETAKRIRSDKELKELHVIALTASAIKGDAEKFIKAGCDGYLSKPIDAEKLREKINQVFLKNYKSGGGSGITGFKQTES